MNSIEKLSKKLSLEFFPPKTEEGRIKLCKTRDLLSELNPRYFSVTFGAGGSTRQGTMDTVFEIHDAGLHVAPHLSCIGTTREYIKELLFSIKERGINRIVALRGDLPDDTGKDSGDFQYANELVEFIRQETGDHFYIEVAAYPEIHPEAPDTRADMLNFKRKVEAGADCAITQYFYNADAYFRFLDDCKSVGVEIPIVAGIMPITSFEQLVRFSDTCGAEIPRWIKKRLESYGDDMESLRAFGIDVTTHLCQQLLDGGAPGLHFFTMNQAGPTTAICKALSL